MGGEPCNEHGLMCGKMGSMEAKIDGLKESVDRAVHGIETHIHEADKPGGIRERVLLLESAIGIQQEAISTIKKSYWKVGIAYSIVGGLIARLAPDVLWYFIQKAVHLLLK